MKIAGAAHLAQRQPDFQRPERPRVLRTAIEIIEDLRVEVVVGRVIRECTVQRRGVANEHTTGLERRVQPLVGIDRDGIGAAQRTQIGGRSGHWRGQGTVGAVHVKPQVLRHDRRQRSPEWIDRARAHRPRGADDQEGLMSGLTILRDLPLQGSKVHPLIAVGAIQRIASVPSPERSAAFWIHVWVSVDA